MSYGVTRLPKFHNNQKTTPRASKHPEDQCTTGPTFGVPFK